MRPWHKGAILAVAHLAIIASMGAKLLYDRSTRPRVWARVAPYDPSLPIRGRYVSLQVEVLARGITPPPATQRQNQPWNRWGGGPRILVTLSVENGQLVATRDPAADEHEAYRSDVPAIFFRGRGTVLAEPVLYFIPEHIQDPSQRATGEELWVEVTLPKKGPPRPIRLGVKRGEAPIQPLDID